MRVDVVHRWRRFAVERVLFYIAHHADDFTKGILVLVFHIDTDLPAQRLLARHVFIDKTPIHHKPVRRIQRVVGSREDTALFKRCPDRPEITRHHRADSGARPLTRPGPWLSGDRHVRSRRTAVEWRR